MTPPRPLQTSRHQTVVAPAALAALPLHVVQPADPGDRHMRPLRVAPAGVMESPHFFLHQLTKTAVERTTGTDDFMDLADLAFAGITEFSRQWMFLHRLDPYSPESGQFDCGSASGEARGIQGSEPSPSGPEFRSTDRRVIEPAASVKTAPISPDQSM